MVIILRMCGLGGIVWFAREHAAGAGVVEEISRRVAHRGPDADGLSQFEINGPYMGAALAHRRLAIIDLDPRANQPMQDNSGDLHLVFNGEIYNFRELRKELQEEYQFHTNSDSEVILAAYRKWGQDCVDYFNGMFAIVIIDLPRRRVFMARDRMGQKPLYVSIYTPGKDYLLQEGDNIQSYAAVAFASELHALQAVPWVSKKINPDSLVEYLAWGYVPAPATLFRNTYCLQPSTGLIVESERTFYWRYFDANEPRTTLGNVQAVRSTAQLIHKAVQRQMVADVPIGCFLSGGIDSSIMALVMKHVLGKQQQVHTFTIGFADPRYDETEYARKVATHLGTVHKEFTVKPDIAADLPRIARAFGQPFAESSALPTHYLAKVTRDHVKVAISGDGGDELFGGYDRYRAMHLIAQMSQPMRSLLGLGLWQRLPGTHPKSALARFKRLARSAAMPATHRYTQYIQLFEPALLLELVGRKAVDDPRFNRFLHGRDQVQSALALDRVSYLPDDLLTKVDRCSMLHALEVRSPFMDHDVVRFAAGVTTEQLLSQGNKTLLRQAFGPSLPPGHFQRPKMGFAVPIGQWLRQELRPMLHDLVHAENSLCREYLQMHIVDQLIEEHQQEIKDHSQRLYALLMLELWRQ